MTHVTCRLTAKNRDQLPNPTLGNRVWATFTFFCVLYHALKAMTPFVDAFVNPSGTNPILENNHFSIFYPYYYYFTKKQTVKNKTDATVASSKQMIMSKSADLVMEF